MCILFFYVHALRSVMLDYSVRCENGISLNVSKARRNYCEARALHRRVSYLFVTKRLKDNGHLKNSHSDGEKTASVKSVLNL